MQGFSGFPRVVEGHRSYSWWNTRNVHIPKSSTIPRILPQAGPSLQLSACSESCTFSQTSKNVDSQEDGAFQTPNPCDCWPPSMGWDHEGQTPEQTYRGMYLKRSPHLATPSPYPQWCIFFPPCGMVVGWWSACLLGHAAPSLPSPLCCGGALSWEASRQAKETFLPTRTYTRG